MAALVPLITLIPFLLLLSSVVAGPQASPIRNVCKASHVPSACEASLSKSGVVPPNADVSQVVESALSFAMSNLDKGRSMIQEIQKASKGNANRTLVSESCLEVLGYGIYRMNLTADALQRKRMKDARAWMSAALAYQYDCWSGLKKVNDSSLVVDAMAFLNSSSMVSSTDALGMLVNYDIFGEEIASWGPPKTEREGFWEPAQDLSKSGDSMKGVPTGLKEDVTVCNNGCKYKTVQAAVDAAPDFLPSGKHFVIGIKVGTYTETVRVPLEKRNVVFLGDGIGKTIITGSLNVGFQGISTFKTATVGVLGDGFMATGVTIQNTAGAAAQQAVAFRTDSDLSILENCEILGNQDTLYAHSLRQYFKSCRIEGNVDFIFGNGAAFFDDCQILIAPRQVDPTKGEDNAVAAHGRTDPAQSTGLFFQNCEITGTEEYMKLYHSNPKVHKTYLGRPWKEYSRAIFINCTLGDLINPDGWMPWDKDFALKTIYFGELENTGLGSNPSKRVPWSNQIPAQHIQSYSILNFINGGDAIPAPAPLPTIPPSPIETPVIPPPTDNDATPPPTNDDVITSPSTPTPSVPVPPPTDNDATPAPTNDDVIPSPSTPTPSVPVPPPTDNDATPPPTNDDVITSPSTPTPSVPVPSPTDNDATPPPTDNDVIPTPAILILPPTDNGATPPPTDNDSIPSPTTSPPPANDAIPTPTPTPPRSSPTTPIAQAPTRSSATTPTSAPIPVTTPTSAPAPIKPSLGTPSSTPTPASSSPAAADSALPSADLSSATPTSAPIPSGSSPATPTSAPVPIASSPATPTSAPVPIASSPATPTSAPVPIASSPATPTSAPTPATPAPSSAYAHQRPDHILYFIFCLLPFII